jgi:hypothetical protein
VTSDFLTRMSNRFRFSRCDTPHLPITEVWEEEITVELRGNILTITANETRLLRSPRIYGLLTLEVARFSIFMIIQQLPAKVTDDAFFPAMGSIVLFEPDVSGKRRLRASGMDKNSGQCRGWIFDASETQ